MACRTCIELQKVAAAAQLPDMPNRLLGLNEAGLRNHARQRKNGNRRRIWHAKAAWKLESTYKALGRRRRDCWPHREAARRWHVSWLT